MLSKLRQNVLLVLLVYIAYGTFFAVSIAAAWAGMLDEAWRWVCVNIL